MSETKVVRALEPFSLNLKDGTPYTVTTGDLYDADDYVVKANPNAFGELTLRSSKPYKPEPTSKMTETASAEPGYKRVAVTNALKAKGGGS